MSKSIVEKVSEQTKDKSALWDYRKDFILPPNCAKKPQTCGGLGVSITKKAVRQLVNQLVAPIIDILEASAAAAAVPAFFVRRWRWV